MSAPRMCAKKYALLIADLRSGHFSFNDMAQHTGLSLNTVRTHVHALREAKQVHIRSWEADSRGCESIALWVLGPGKDAARRLQTRAEIKARHRARNRKLQQLSNPLHQLGRSPNKPNETPDHTTLDIRDLDRSLPHALGALHTDGDAAGEPLP